MSIESIQPESSLSGEKQALMAIRRLKARVEVLERSQTEPIACVGMGCRFPGGVDRAAAYWELLVNQRGAVREVPQDRWNIEDYYDPDPDAPGKMSSRWGGFLDRVDLFDAGFFGITPREAAGMDPQQRLLLEVAWEALEDAGESAALLMGAPGGVFVGISTNDYLQLRLKTEEASEIDAYFGSGTSHSIAAGRISYVLGLRGPSISVDTACSSSLVAVHLACQSLRNDECRFALAGGVNLVLCPEGTINLSKAHMMAPDGRCKTFDAAANGFVRGEGCGVVVLKRLSQALADGNRILALIRGTAINQDGRSNGLTAPNEAAQEAVIREALRRSQVSAEQIGYVEAHGTGTALGDPIEVQALASALGEGRSSSRPIFLGSVKTNLGHLEAAAGIAGLIKVILALWHKQIPGNLHLNERSPYIQWEQLPVRLEIPQRTIDWNSDRARFAGVSSFGFSGTNAHVILEEAAAEGPAAPPPGCALMPISAVNRSGLLNLTRRYGDLCSRAEGTWADACFTASIGRSHFEHRHAVVADSWEEAATVLKKAQQSEGASAEFQRGRTGGPGPGGVTFLFTGQGAQYFGMGHQLYRHFPLYRQILDHCDAILRSELDTSLLAMMFDDAGAAGRLNATGFAQPALFVLEYGLAMLWQSWGVQPSFGLGHSLGEYTAAAVAGVLTLEDALRLVARRGRLMQSLPAGGSMAAILADEGTVRRYLEFEPDVSIAALNGPANVVISGPSPAVDRVHKSLQVSNVRVERLTVSHAFHSGLIEPILEQLERAANLTHHPPQFGLASNLTGELITGVGTYGPGYWRRHARQPVAFAQGIATLVDRGCTLFLEMGPSPVLAGMGRQCKVGESLTWLASLRQGRDELRQIWETLGTLYVRGFEIRWEEVYRGSARRRISLPTYPFQRERFWLKGAQPHPPKPPSGSRHTAEGRELTYQVTWRRLASDSTEVVPKLTIPTIQDVTEGLEERWSGHAAISGLSTYDALLPQVAALCGAFAVCALSPLEAALHSKTPRTEDWLGKQLGVAPAQRSLFHRLLQILAEDGWVQSDGDGWQLMRPFERVDPLKMLGQLQESFPSCPEIEILARCGPRLREVLQGQCDPMPLLFPEGSTDLAERLYVTSPIPVTYNSTIGDAVSRFIADWTSAVPPRILEVGGGTGGTTKHVLPMIFARDASYTFTDISPFFVNRAREKFSGHGSLSFRTYDLERENREQGLEPDSYDLILAANVVHATANLRQSLARLHELLHGNGVLILLELTSAQRFGDLTMGMTQGWWRLQDHDLRPDYPLPSRSTWRRALSESGFDSIVAVPEGRGGIASEYTILVSRAVGNSGLKLLPASRHWAIVAGDEAAGKGLTELLRARGENARYMDISSEVDAERMGGAAASDLSEVGRWIGKRTKAESIQLVYLPRRFTRSEALTVETTAYIGPALTLIELVRLATEQRSGARCKVRVITFGAEPALAADVPNPAHALFWGLGRVLELEHPDAWGGLVDLPESDDALSLASLATELAGGDGDDQLAIRGSARYAPRLAPLAPSTSETEVSIKPDASYLVTGGLGHLGPKIARWLIDQGAKSLVLTSRMPLPTRSRWDAPGLDAATRERIRVVQSLERLGATVEVLNTDAGSGEQMAKLMDELLRRKVPLRGIFHAAGVSYLKPSLELRAEDLEAVWGAKLEAALTVHRLLAAEPIDFVVYFSSAAAIWGSTGLAHYAAANHFLDALAVSGRRTGLPVVSINWGRWGTSTSEAEGFFESIGLKVLDERAAFSAMASLIAGQNEQATIASVDWDRFKAVYSVRGHRRLLDMIGQSASGTGGEAQESSRHSNWNEIPQHERLGWLRRRVGEEVARVIGLASQAGLETDKGFFELGMDSLMSVELKRRLEALIGRSLPASVTFDYSTVERLSAHLFEQLHPVSTGKPKEEPVAQPTETTDLLEMIEGLSDEEATNLLQQRSQSGEGTQTS